MGDLEFYSGKLVYKEMEFNFVFDKCELRLIPLKAIAAVVYEEKENWQYIIIKHTITNLFFIFKA